MDRHPGFVKSQKNKKHWKHHEAHKSQRNPLGNRKNETHRALPHELKPIGYERRLAIVRGQKLEAERLMMDARNYSPQCPLACKTALEKANRASKLFMSCARFDDRFKEMYTQSLELSMEIILGFELQTSGHGGGGGGCNCGEVFCADKTFLIDGILWGHVVDSL